MHSGFGGDFASSTGYDDYGGVRDGDDEVPVRNRQSAITFETPEDDDDLEREVRGMNHFKNVCEPVKTALFFPQTNFVRQKTPHPKELKAKAHKLFGASGRPGGKPDDEAATSPEAQEAGAPEQQPPPPTNGDAHHFADEQQQHEVQGESRYPGENGAQEDEDDQSDEVGRKGTYSKAV